MPWDIAGHSVAVDSLQASLASGQVAHAYMFTGPRAVGKARLARLFAKALLCEVSTNQAPCGACRSCRRIDSGNHPDLHWVSPIGASLRIDQVRELQTQMALRPYEGRYKVCVLDDADTLTEQAQNSMLKSLEEPVGNGVFLLIAHNPGALLPTIHSRCQVLHLRPVSAEAIAQLLQQEKGLTPSEANLLAALADGRPGDALSLDPAVVLARRDKVAEWCAALRRDGVRAVLRVAEELDKEEDLPVWLAAMTIWWRDIWHCYTSPSLPLVNRDKEVRLRQEAAGWGNVAVQAIEAINTARRQLSRNANKRLVLDLLFMRIQRGLPS